MAQGRAKLSGTGMCQGTAVECGAVERLAAMVGPGQGQKGRLCEDCCMRWNGLLGSQLPAMRRVCDTERGESSEICRELQIV